MGLAQFRIAAAEDQLLGLGEELDLANAAPAQLDVVPLDRDVVAALVRRDLALDRVDIPNGPEVQVLAPDEGSDFAQEGFAEGTVAGHGPCLDHGRPLPVLTQRLVVGHGSAEGDGDGHGPRIGPQPQVGPADVALGRALLQQLNQVAGQPDHGFRRAAFAAAVDPLGIVEDDQIDVGGVVELSGSQFPHTQDQIAAGLGRLCRVGQRQLLALMETSQQQAESGVDRRGGEVGERAGDPLERPEAGDVGQRDRQRAVAAGLPQGNACRSGVFGEGRRARLLQQRLDPPVRPLGQNSQEAGEVRQDTAAEEGRVAEDGFEQTSPRRIVEQRLHGLRRFGVRPLGSLHQVLQTIGGLDGIESAGQRLGGRQEGVLHEDERMA